MECSHRFARRRGGTPSFHGSLSGRNRKLNHNTNISTLEWYIGLKRDSSRAKQKSQIVRVPLFVLPHAFLCVFLFKCRWKGDILKAHFNSTFPFSFGKSHSKNLVMSLQEMFNFLRSAFRQTVTEGKRKQQQKHVLDCFDMFWPSTPKTS